jgi:hypothetical protein
MGGFDAVAIGAIASVVIAIVVVGFIAYQIVKRVGEDKQED